MSSFSCDLLACPRCRGSFDEVDGSLRCGVCAARYAAPRGIPALRIEGEAEAAAEGVRSFYSAAPFPGYAPGLTMSGLRGRAARSEFARKLDRAIPGDATILDLGCGTGQLSLFLATAQRRVVGADLTRASLELGAEAATRLGVKGVEFVETDLRAPGLREEAFDVVVTSGVLHHLPDPREGFRAVARLVHPGGVVVVGLYNAIARLPHRARRAIARASGFRFFPFDPVLRDRGDPSRREAWLRDQYQHPIEHRHTVAEVQRWFEECGLDYVRCFPSSILGEEDSSGLFEGAADDWWPENAVAQFGWMKSLWAEGGLFVAVGVRRRAS